MNLKRYLLLFPCLFSCVLAADRTLQDVGFNDDFPLLTPQEISQIVIHGQQYQQAYNTAENLQNSRILGDSISTSHTHPPLVDSPLGLEDKVAVVKKADELRRELFPLIFQENLDLLKEFFSKNYIFLNNSKILLEFQFLLPEANILLPLMTLLLKNLDVELNHNLLQVEDLSRKMENSLSHRGLEGDWEQYLNLENQAVLIRSEIDKILLITPLIKRLEVDLMG